MRKTTISCRAPRRWDHQVVFQILLYFFVYFTLIVLPMWLSTPDIRKTKLCLNYAIIPLASFIYVRFSPLLNIYNAKRACYSNRAHMEVNHPAMVSRFSSKEDNYCKVKAVYDLTKIFLAQSWRNFWVLPFLGPKSSIPTQVGVHEFGLITVMVSCLHQNFRKKKQKWKGRWGFQKFRRERTVCICLNLAVFVPLIEVLSWIEVAMIRSPGWRCYTEEPNSCSFSH